jgi:hypothetical protein
MSNGTRKNKLALSRETVRSLGIRSALRTGLVDQQQGQPPTVGCYKHINNTVTIAESCGCNADWGP